MRQNKFVVNSSKYHRKKPSKNHRKIIEKSSKTRRKLVENSSKTRRKLVENSSKNHWKLVVKDISLLISVFDVNVLRLRSTWRLSYKWNLSQIYRNDSLLLKMPKKYWKILFLLNFYVELCFEEFESILSGLLFCSSQKCILGKLNSSGPEFISVKCGNFFKKQYRIRKTCCMD